jgi:Cu2+-exporting ATPase
MKTSVIEVHDMLSALSVDAVEKRIGKVPGVESVTVNHAARSATVRYDETRQVTALFMEPTIFREVCHD